MRHKKNGERSDPKDALHEALRQWHKEGSEPPPLQDYLIYRRAVNCAPGSSHATTKSVVMQALHRLEQRSRDDAILLRRSFLDNELDRRIARDLNVAESTLYRHKETALERLASALVELEHETVSSHRAALTARLEPPSSTHLINIEQSISRLEPLLAAQQAPWIVALSGMGGIGKTALADAAVRHLIDLGSIDEVEWISARAFVYDFGRGVLPANGHAPLTAEALLDRLATRVLEAHGGTRHQTGSCLWQRLKERPYLIVFDNLDTVVDAPRLLATLRHLANPSKFLLTSRENLFAETDVYTFAVPELDRAGALAFVRHEAAQRNLPSLANAGDEALRPILDTVGGNPLAIRLIVGQVHVHELDVVLENLRQAHGKRNEDLYGFIFRRAWEQLDEVPRRALFAMQLANPSGLSRREIAGLSGIDQQTLVEALDMLVQFNLVERSDELRERRYRVHSLTRTFLHEQVLRWM